MASHLVATYSIAACDLEAGQWGVATQSKFLGVGSVVPWAEPGVGAIATQAYANPQYGPKGSAMEHYWMTEYEPFASAVERVLIEHLSEGRERGVLRRRLGK